MAQFKSSLKFWRNLTAVATLLLFSIIIWDFIVRNIDSNVLSTMSALYAMVLSIFTANKEFERWHDYHKEKHPGEIYVIGWTILFFGLMISDYIFKMNYEIPHQVVAVYILVLGILAITKKSSHLYKAKKRRN